MQIRNLRYLLALDAERHFARAALACNVSQPTLSAGIVALEEQLARRLVDRDRRFIGFTPDGEAALPWARQVVAAVDGLRRVVGSAVDAVRGELRLGMIPASMPIAGPIAAALRLAYPAVEVAISSHTSREIVRRLAEFSLDAGVTYLEHEPPEHVVRVPLYEERMIFVEGGPSDITRSGIAWADALARPLCLLHQGMQNRRILDANLAARSLAVRAVATADSYVALLALVRSGVFATIMPDIYAPLLPSWARVTRFDPPMPPSVIGLIVPDRAPRSPLATAVLSVAGRLGARE